MVTIALTLCFLSTLFPCFMSFKKMKEEFNEPSLALFLCLVLYSFVLLYGVVIRECGIAGVQSQVADTITQMGNTLTQFKVIVSVLTLALIIPNVIIGFIIQKTKRPITYSLAFVIVIMCIMSVPAVIITGSNPLVNFFLECCGIMAYFAWVLDLTYKEFCVLGNIYLQAGLCLVSALAPLMLCLRTRKGILKTAFCVINAMLHAAVFYVISVHYWMPLEDGFDLCYRELNQMAAFTGTSYVMVNIIIFVIIFVADIIVNAVIYQSVKRTA